eukprot:NODE_3769_length_745_cov_201.126087.p1 GENE.NODE_3769_length_745_cov_201.126087~~NODE_3769_length_745_cov_201.126087.p1  ORF type:complete len:152 (-),score=20.28 NODE_3769_length_745_cov_201.126087:273-668(-)
MLAAVRADGRALQFVPDPFKADREIVCVAASNHYKAISYASRALRGDRAIALAAVSTDANAIGGFDDSVQKDVDVVIAALHQDSGTCCWRSFVLSHEDRVRFARVIATRMGEFPEDLQARLRREFPELASP